MSLANVMDWEKKYTEALIKGLEPFGDVLEIGFSCGYASTLIQKSSIKSHTIIETDAEMAKDARSFASKHPNVTVIQKSWQDALPSLDQFDAIFVNNSACKDSSEKTMNLMDAKQVVEKGNEFLSTMDEKFPGIKTTQYSDETIDRLFEKLDPMQHKMFSRFLLELKENNQISSEQYQRHIKKYFFSAEDHTGPLFTFNEASDSILPLLLSCLKDHLRVNGRFSYFNLNPLSKYDDTEFFETIITNPNLRYQETLIDVDVPKDCEYYHSDKALVALLQKIA